MDRCRQIDRQIDGQMKIDRQRSNINTEPISKSFRIKEKDKYKINLFLNLKFCF